MPNQPRPALLDRLTWLGHDAFEIVDPASGKRVYFDPFRIDRQEPADLVLISHAHYDHLSPDDLAKIAKPDTVFVTTPDAAKQLTGQVVTVRPGDRVVAAGLSVEAVPAYNLTKFRSPGVPFHPKDVGGVGFILTVGGERVYHAGDTDRIPEMAGLRPDVALLPVSGTYVMTAEEAAEAATDIQPRVAVPMHYAAIVGSEADAQRFVRLCGTRGVDAVLLPKA